MFYSVILFLGLLFSSAQAQDVFIIAAPDCPDGCHDEIYTVTLERIKGGDYSQTWSIVYPSSVGIIVSGDWRYSVTKDWQCIIAEE